MPRAKNAGAYSHQSPRLLLVRAVPKLRRVRTMRKLQHFHDPSQAPQSARMPLLWVAEADTEALSQVPIEIRLFLWRRLRAPGGAFAQRISWRAHCPTRPPYRTHEAGIS